jgi:predicted nucleic acid-binding protein
MADKPTFYWDACMFYEVLGNEQVDPQKRAKTDEILAENEKKENLIVTSVVCHLEVLPEKLEGKGAKDAEDYLALFDAVHFAEIEINANIILRAREIRNHYFKPPDDKGANGKMMDLGDAIHLATASIYGVKEFHTRDKDHKGPKVPLIGLYKAYNETKLCGKYELDILSPESPQGVLALEPTKPAEVATPETEAEPAKGDEPALAPAGLEPKLESAEPK